MKTVGKAGILLLILISAASVAEPGVPGEPARSFSFDNGAGLSGSAAHYRFNSRHGDFYSHNGTPVSRYLVHRAYGAGALHYGGTTSEDEHHYYGGASLGPATLAYFQGKADSFSKSSNPLYSDLNQYFFHGGRRSTFEFQGAGANLELGGGVSSQVAFSTVRAPGVENRDGYYAGVAHRHVEAGVFQLDRGDETVGHGLNLAFSAGRMDLEYQDIRSEYGARLSRVALQWQSAPAQSFSIELEQARNDLYSRADDQRVMLRFRKRLGRTPAFNAAEDQGDESATGRPGFGRIVGIGAGLGAAAIALSSGDSGDDGAQRFAVRNNAASNVLNQINPVSVRQNIEHGGWIYRNADNTFSHTRPVAGTVNSVNIGSPSTSVPRGTTASASYHTHGGPDPRFDNENFSPQDLLSDRLAGVDGYLGTPAGFMKLHNVRTNSITVVGRINN